ncbi:hypothetical protein CI610_01347 [invertebrate metagenome]|uniref:PepSY domain-containing protein n=1 Tax=invertebrate metagenome TaxID=1711999 RepID=A0A2H9T8Y3_9ZZZZ
MKSFLLRSSAICITLSLPIVSYLPTTASSTTGNPQSQSQAKKASADHDMAVLLTVVRKNHPSITVISSSWEKKGETLRVLYALSKNNQLHVMTVNRHSAKITQNKPYKLPDKVDAMNVEKLLTQLKPRFNIKRVNKTLLEQKENRLIRTVFFTDNLKRQRIVRVDALTGETLEQFVRKP